MLICWSDLDERSKKIQAFNVLVHKLPRVNFELLRHMSLFLIEIVDNAGVNKMTIRNVGIVFAPTLNIPAPLISFFLTDYPDIFGMPADDSGSFDQDVRVNGHFDDEVRPPLRQKNSDIPNSTYDQHFQPQLAVSQQQWNGRPPSAFPMNNAPNYPPPQPPQQQQQQQHYVQHSNYEPGFDPRRPNYDAHNYEQQYHGTDGYGNGTSGRQSGNVREQKQKRRESSMLLMNAGMGQRKGSNGSNPPRHRDDFRNNPMLIREETAFD